VKKLPALALAGIAAAAIAGTAIAAGSKTHVMNVALPDGSVAHIQYVGDIAPKVTVQPRRLAGIENAWRPMPSFTGFGRMMEEMSRRNADLMRQVQQMPIAPGMNAASYGSLPAGGSSTSIVSYSNGDSTCTRTTEVVSQGAGKPPKVTTNVSGDCSTNAAPRAPAGKSSAPIDRT
jgi:hypothetical protein